MTLLIRLCKVPDGDAVQGDVCHVMGLGKPKAKLWFASVTIAMQTLTAADVPENDVDNAEHRLLNGQQWQYEHECEREYFDALVLYQARTDAVDSMRRDFEGYRLLEKRRRPDPDDDWN
jgi:hypothetical protein